jgi:plasmid stabilization system protein ParE
MKVHIEPAALAEAEDARDWYDAARAGLGEEFLSEFERGLQQIMDFPNAWHPVGPRARRYRLKRFPHGIVYQIRPDEILVVAVAHLHRRADYWRGRLKAR